MRQALGRHPLDLTIRSSHHALLFTVLEDMDALELGIDLLLLKLAGLSGLVEPFAEETLGPRLVAALPATVGVL